MMEMFVNGLMVTLGVTAVGVVAYCLWLMRKVPKKFLRGMVKRRRHADWEMMNKIETQFQEERQAENEQGAFAVMRDPKVSEVVGALRAVPYTSKHTKVAQKQRTQRQKLQVRLRKLVPDAGVREALYEMAK